jgi:LacI family transcriptional regulator
MKRPVRVLLAFHHYHAAYHEGAARYAREAGWTLDALPAQSREFPRDDRYDGILVHALGPSELRRLVETSRLPTVDLTGTLARAGVPKVMHDYHAVAAAAADYLIGLGWKHLAFYLSQPLRSFPADRERLYWAGFQRAAQARGREVSLLEWRPRRGGAGHDARFEWLGEGLLRLPKPLAVWAWDDYAAVEVLDACAAKDLLVPRQVAVLGNHNETLVCDFTRVPLSSVGTNRALMAYQGCRLLDGLIRGRTDLPAVTLVQPGEICQRQSTALNEEQMPVNLSKVVRLIRSHFHGPLAIPELARRAGMSVRLLQRELRAATGMSPSELLVRCRMENARRLLLETNSPVERIGELCGYGSLSAFTQAFTREVGMAPQRFRREGG